MYETMIFVKMATVAWPVIKVAFIVGAVAYTYSKVKKVIHKRKRIKVAKTQTDVNAKNSKGQTQLMSVASTKEAQILLDRGIDINAVDKNGNNAAMYIQNNEILSFLIEKGIDINVVNKDGKNALMLNAIKGNDKNIKLLMQNGADKTLQDNDGKSILQHYLENAIRERRGAGSKIPEGQITVDADVLKGLMAPNEIDPREKTKKIMSLQGVKGHKRMDDCQKNPSIKEETIKEDMTVEPKEEKKQAKSKASQKNTIQKAR